MNYLSSCCGGSSYPCNNYGNYFYNCGRGCQTAGRYGCNRYYGRYGCGGYGFGCGCRYGYGRGYYGSGSIGNYTSPYGYGLGCSSCSSGY